MFKLLSKNIIIYGGTNALKSLIPLLMLPILTKYLSKEEYGVLSIIETSILFITPFILLNINASINVEYFKLKHEELRKYITNAFLMSIISFSILMFIDICFRKNIANILHISEFIVLCLVIFAILRVISSVLLGIYQSRQEPIKFASFTLSQTILDFVLSYIFVVLFKYGYIGRLMGTYIAYGTFSIIGIYLLFKMNYIGKITFKYTRNILNFGLPLIPHSVSGTILAMSDRYFISYFEGNARVGIYTVSYQLSALMLLVGMSINQAWSPMFFKLLKKKDIAQVKKITLFLFLFFIIVGIIVYNLEDILFAAFVHKNFYEAKKYFVWLLLGFIFQSFYFLVTNLLFFEKRTKLLASITTTGAIINVILNYFFIKQFGTIGVAYATAITWFLQFIVVLYISKKIIEVKYEETS